MERLPDELSLLDSLEELTILAKELTPKLSQLKKLKEISCIPLSTYYPINEINIEQYTDVLLSCTSLEEINLSYCGLKKFPIRLVSKHPSVKKIYIYKNLFKKLPCEIVNAKSVELLAVSHLLTTYTIPKCLQNIRCKIY